VAGQRAVECIGVVRARAAAANAGAATAARQQRVREPQGRAEKSTPAGPEGRARRRRGRPANFVEPTSVSEVAASGWTRAANSDGLDGDDCDLRGAARLAHGIKTTGDGNRWFLSNVVSLVSCCIDRSVDVVFR